MVENRRSRKRLMIIAMIGIGTIALLTGAANAAMQSIQLNSAASFPVDI
ncbi:MAG: hypothetical protein R8K49_00070 [Mariprofundaceae bacterium]